jgi:thiopeptide-type bacteriocin biosynthesis protein
VLPLVHDWAGELCAAGFAQRLVLDTYEPEAPRYGGPGALEAAERAFHADSEAVLATLRLAGRPPVELLLATAFVDLAAAYGDPDWRDWLLTAYPKDGSHSAFQAIRREALAAIVERKVEPALAEIWRIRAGAIRAYGDRVRALQPAGPSPLGSLLHMHHNRLAGVEPDVERAAYAIARGALQAQRDRERATR